MLGQKIKITVLKRTDLTGELNVTMPLPPDAPPEAAADVRCPVFREGQTFLYTHGGGGVPDGFCDWAWGDIFKDVLAMCGKADYMQGRCGEIPPAYTCCTDGLRPVIFRVEAVD